MLLSTYTDSSTEKSICKEKTLSKKSDHTKRKQKVTLSIDSEIWRKFIVKVIWDSGKQKAVSQIVEKLLIEYLGEKNFAKASIPQLPPSVQKGLNNGKET
jgi:hypothetical protein